MDARASSALSRAALIIFLTEDRLAEGKKARAMRARTRARPRPRVRLPSRLLLLRRATVVISDNSNDPPADRPRRNRTGELFVAANLAHSADRAAPRRASRASDNIRAASVMRERSSASVILQEVRDSFVPTYLPTYPSIYLATYLSTYASYQSNPRRLSLRDTRVSA